MHKSATAPLVQQSLAEFITVEDGKVVVVLDKAHLLQRFEILETIVDKLEQRLSVLEQGQISRFAPPVKTFSSKTCSPLSPQGALLLEVGSTPERVEIKEAQAELEVNECPRAPSPTLDTCFTEAWRKGLTTNQLVARLKTNPNTLKKYLRDLKQIQWAAQRDPEGLGWTYHSPLQCYYPLQVKLDSDLSSQNLSIPKIEVEVRTDAKQQDDVVHKDGLDSLKHRQLIGKGGLYQADLTRLTGIPINTLQRWKHLPDCTDRIYCRTEGRHCYWYSKQTKRFYPLDVPAVPSSGAALRNINI